MKQTRELTRASHMVPEDRELFQPFYRLAQSGKGLFQATLRVLLKVVGAREGRCCRFHCLVMRCRRARGCVRQPLFEAHLDSQSPALERGVYVLCTDHNNSHSRHILVKLSCLRRRLV